MPFRVNKPWKLAYVPLPGPVVWTPKARHRQPGGCRSSALVQFPLILAWLAVTAVLIVAAVAVVAVVWLGDFLWAWLVQFPIWLHKRSRGLA